MRLSISQGGEETWIVKRLLSRQDLVATPVGTASDPTLLLDQLCHMRFSHKTEERIAPPPPEMLGALEGVRDKRRWSFIYKMWRFDLSLVRGAPVAAYEEIDTAR